MTMKTPNTEHDDGGPAFPQTVDDMGALTVATSGMSLRDWFAGQALAGMLGDPERSGEFAEFARYAYQAADAMLAARKERQ